MTKRLGGVIATFLSAAFAVWVALSFTKGNAPLQLGDPGELVRWAQPIVQSAKNLAIAATVGSLVLGAWAYSEGSTELQKMLRRVWIASSAWVVLGSLHVLLTFLWVTGVPLSGSSAFGSALLQFTTEIELGQALTVNLGFGLVINLVALMVSSLRSTLFLATLSLAALVPLALVGHASGTAGHDAAVNSMGMHLVAVTIWVGGLIELAFVRNSENFRIYAKRYSTLALLAFLVTAVSGIASAALRIADPKYLFTQWGLLAITKVAILIVLGIFGARYRLSLLKTKNFKESAFVKLAIAELALMGLAFGIGAALSRSETPSSRLPVQEANSPAVILTGEPLPPELTLERWFTSYKMDLVWLSIAIGATILYLYGVYKLRKRGDEWPLSRTVTWVAGMALLAWVTCGPLSVYEQYLFSVHMLAHMLLTMGVPVLLVPGAPVTLLLRASEARTDESRGLREWVLWAVHTPWAKLVTNPIFAGINFAASLVIFYYTPLFAWSTKDHLGHQWMIVHFLITGYLFVQALVGIDPGPAKLSYVLRLLLLIGTLAFHAFFGLSLMSGDALLLPEWYGAMGRTWGESPLDDQHTGGAIAWGIGEMPAAVLTIIVSIQWFKSDIREARRLDRASDRTGNKDVQDYNAMLQKLAERDGENR